MRVPRSVSQRASARTTGVLPVPPTVRLPTHTTGIGTVRGRAARRRSAPTPAIARPIGSSRRGQTPSRAQNSGARMVGFRLGGFDDGNADQAVGVGRQLV